MRHFVLTFHTHFEALTALKQAQKSAEIHTVKLIAVPRKLSSGCGTALSVSTDRCSVFEQFGYDELFECFEDEKFIKVQ